MLRLVLSVVLPLLVGLPFTLRLRSWPMRIAVGFLVGVVIICAGAIAVGAAGLGLGFRTAALVAVPWLGAAALVIRSSATSIALRPSWPPRWHWSAWVLLALTLFNLVAAAGYAFKTPVADTDVVKVWLPKAVLLGSSGFKALAHSVYPDYPPLWPVHMYLAGAGGTWLKLLPSVYFVAIVVVVFEYVRPRVGPAIAAASALAVSGVPYIWLPYGVNDLMSEVPTTAFVVASTILLAEYVEQPSATTAALVAICGIGVVWTRPEGFFHALLVGAILLAAGVRFKRLRETVLPAAAIVVAYLGWRFVVRYAFHYAGGLSPDLSRLGPSLVLSEVGDTIRYAAANVGNPYLLGPALIAVALVALGIAYWRSFWVVGVVFGLDIAIGVVTYLALPTTDVGEPLIWWLTTGFKRMVMHSIPLLYVAAGLAIGLAWQDRLRMAPAWIPKIDLSRRSLAAVAMASLTILAIGIAAVANYLVGGPKSFDLSEMGPSHVSTPSAVVYPSPGVMSTTTAGNSATSITFYLLSTGRRLPPLDNISGTFSDFSSSVSVDAQGGPAETFSVVADGRSIAAVTVRPGDRPVTLHATIPPGTRLLELSVRQLGPGVQTVFWTHPTVDRFSAWWLEELLLVFAAAAIAVVALRPRTGNAAVHMNSGWALGALVAAAALQQLEATAAIALPALAYAARLAHLM